MEILRGYGITEESCGCPIVSSMDTVQVGTYGDGHPVFIDKQAAQADAVIVMNRIKPHTGFTSPYGSGLAKMISIGMGKQKGADSMHNAGFGVFPERVPGFAKVILDNTNIKLGIAIIENAYDETCRLEVLPAHTGQAYLGRASVRVYDASGELLTQLDVCWQEVERHEK